MVGVSTPPVQQVIVPKVHCSREGFVFQLCFAFDIVVTPTGRLLQRNEANQGRKKVVKKGSRFFLLLIGLGSSVLHS